MATWAIHDGSDTEFSKAISTISTLNGPVGDVESVFTDLVFGRGAFLGLEDATRNRLTGSVRRCLRAYLREIHGKREARLYRALARKIVKGDVVVTFNYDLSFENELIPAGRFRVCDGYGFKIASDEAGSDVVVLKPHGSINWIGQLFNGDRAFGHFSESRVPHPFVDNHESLLPGYDSRVLDPSFQRGGVDGPHCTLVLPTYEKRYSVSTSVDDNEWASFYESIWSQADIAVERADRIVIIGYSLPEADRRSGAMLLWHGNKNMEVAICCGVSNASLKARFENHGFRRVVDIGNFEDFCRCPVSASHDGADTP